MFDVEHNGGQKQLPFLAHIHFMFLFKATSEYFYFLTPE